MHSQQRWLPFKLVKIGSWGLKGVKKVLDTTIIYAPAPRAIVHKQVYSLSVVFSSGEGWWECDKEKKCLKNIIGVQELKTDFKTLLEVPHMSSDSIFATKR